MKAASNQRVGKTRISQRKTRRTIRICKIHNSKTKEKKSHPIRGSSRRSLGPKIGKRWWTPSENHAFLFFQTMSVLMWCPNVALSLEAQFTFSNPFTITNVSNWLKIVDKSHLYQSLSKILMMPINPKNDSLEKLDKIQIRYCLDA